MIPLEGEESLEEVLTHLGGGHLSVYTGRGGVPKGSGLGTSSILSGAAVKAVFRFLGIEKEEQDIFAVVSLHGTDHEHWRRLAGSGWAD